VPHADRARSSREQRPLLYYVSQGTCLLLLIYVIVVNINGLPSHPLARHEPGKRSFLKTACGLGQKWNMFDEIPSRNGWYVALAKLRDGSEVDLLRHGAAVDWTKPDFPAGRYPNHRWRKCFREMAYEDVLGYHVFRVPVAEFLCRQWNSRPSPAQQVMEFDLIYCMREEPTPTGRSNLQFTVRERLVHLDFSDSDGLTSASSR
jgi:hypothetical protein